MKKRKNIWIYASLIGLIVALLVGFLTFQGESKTIGTGSVESTESIESESGEVISVEWKNFELKDINSGEEFMLEDFMGKPVLLETFAVWCPTCTKQQRNIKDFHEEVGDSVVSVSLNVDPNEDESKVREHIEKNGFDWKYAIAPDEMTRALIDSFGPGVVNAPSVPIILICENGDYRKLGGSGSRSPDKLKSEIENGC